MNSAPISPGISAIFSALLSDHGPESVGGGQPVAASGIDFSELLNNQQDAGKLMQRLETLLPPQDFERLKLALEDGKSLPQAVTIAVGQPPDSGCWEPESSSPVAITLQQSPLNMDELQSPKKNPFAGSPDNISASASASAGASPGPLVQQPPFNTGEPQPLNNNSLAGSPDTIPVSATANTGPSPSLFVQQSQIPAPAVGTGMMTNPSEGIEGKSKAAPQPVIKLPSSAVAGSSDPLRSISASSEKPGQAMNGDADESGRIPVARNLLRPVGAGSVIPPQPLQGVGVPANPASSVVGPSAAMQSIPASSDKPGQTMGRDGDSTTRLSITENLFRAERAGSVAPSQPLQGLTIPAAAISTEPMQAASGLARILTQPKVPDQPPVFTQRAAAGTIQSPELSSHAVIDAGRTIPTTPVTDNLIQPVKPDFATLQQFATAMSTATVAADQGSQASAAASISGAMGGPVSQTGSLLLQSSSPVNMNLEAPVGTKDWGEAVGERVMWMVGRTIQGATLRVTPPHLGAIDIQLTMQQDQTSVSFTTQNGAVREALEAAIPRLREMFGESNLQLANVDVNQRQAEDQRGMFGSDGRNKGNGSEMGEGAQRGMTDTGNESQSPNHLTDPNTDRLLDHYA